MFNSHQERGRVILAVRVHSVARTLFWWVFSILLASLTALGLMLKPLRWNSLQAVCILLSRIGDILFHPWIKFQEGGVEIPVNRDSGRVRFMRCNQLRRWSWDGDLLILTGTHSQGGAVRIPEAERLAVEQVLSTNLAVR